MSRPAPQRHPFDPPFTCAKCPRLVAFRRDAEEACPGGFNLAVPSFGDTRPWLLIVGLAPGMQGANRTGRPFTGDYAGDLLYETLLSKGLASGHYDRRPENGLTLNGCLITNAVRCLPPQNKPTTTEVKTCQTFLEQTLRALPELRVVLCLGKIAHDAVVRACGAPLSRHPFGHAAEHDVNGFKLLDSYHCSRYNTNTGRLTSGMFGAVFDQALALK